MLTLQGDVITNPSSEQVDWYIDSGVGDDGNNGASGFPIKTINEYLARVGTGIVTVQQQIYLTGDFDEGNYVFQAIYQEGLDVWGERTVIGTGTLTNVQAWNEATDSDGQVEDTSIPTSWTASGFVTQMMVMSSGANSGAVAWIGKDLGSKTARHSPMCQPWGSTRVDPSIGDEYEIVILTTITGSFIWKGWTSGWGINFQDVHFHLVATQFMGWVGTLDGALYLCCCALTSTPGQQCIHMGYIWDLWQCKIQLGGDRIDVTQGALLGILYDLIGSRISCYEGANLELNEALLQSDLGGAAGCTISLSRNAVSVMFMGVVGYYDETDVGTPMMKISLGGKAIMVGTKIIGSGNANTILKIGAASCLLYPDGDNFTDHVSVTTSGTQAIVGGTSKTYVEIGATGFVNVANNAMIVPSEY